MEQTPKVDLGKDTRKEILAALKGIRLQISQAKVRETAPADVAADVLASGGGPFAAMKEALAVKGGQIKKGLVKKFDPLNIINRATGGSKLATVLAGKVMGRSEQSIRSAAGLQPIDNTASTSVAEPFPSIPSTPEDIQHGATREERDRAMLYFEQIAKAVVLIASRVTDIANKMGATKKIKLTPEGRLRDTVTGKFVSGKTANYEAQQTQLLAKLVQFATDETRARDTAGDKSVEAQYEERFKKAAPPTRITTSTAAPSDQGKGGGWLSWILGMLSGPVEALVAAISGGLTFAAKTVTSIVSSAISGAKSLLEDTWSFLKGTGGKAIEKVKDLGSSAVNAVRGMIGKPVEPKPVPTVPETVPPVDATKKPPAPAETVPPVDATKKPPAPAPGKKPIPEKVGKKTIKDAIKKVGGKVLVKAAAKAIPGIAFATAISNLLSGDKTQFAIDLGVGLSSLAVGPGTLTAAATGFAATLVNDAYKEMYGIDPVSDPLRAQRLPELAMEAEKYVKENMPSIAEKAPQKEPAIQQSTAPGVTTQPGTTTPSVPPTEVPVPQSTAGIALSNMAEQRITGAAAPASSVNAPTITAIKNNNIHSTMVNQVIASPRNGESSYLRSLDRNYAPA